MEVKKSPKANLENNKQLYFLMGLVVALSVVFTAFELGQKEIKFQDISSNQVVEEVENIDATPPEDNTAPPPPPPPPAPAVPEEINVVENDAKIDQFEVLSVDDNQNKEQAVFAPPSAGTGRAEAVQDDQVFDFLEEMPEFPGGEVEMMKFLQKNVVYPTIAQENGIQGRVSVGFVVEKDGSVSDVKVLRGVDPSLDKEAVRVVKSMPKWKPGMQTGKPVRCRFTIPVNFRLR
ncbi:energy transducer TonB [Porphyromonas sp.]|uniref:energy transducer TonB n=1 Tax=Porphyromonas sp. TaxID=1924944 RepID=UPI0026DBDA96|nr:energy transducer TonB [Porphyromonas sp.]MDO4770720.1 energy transducer TonB [Porphyromonas sp.]